jgi:hypothetical protein
MPDRMSTTVVALEIRYGDADRPVVEVRIGEAWYPGEVHRSVHNGSDWRLQVIYSGFGTSRLGTFPANRVRPLSFSMDELRGVRFPA